MGRKFYPESEYYAFYDDKRESLASCWWSDMNDGWCYVEHNMQDNGVWFEGDGALWTPEFDDDAITVLEGYASAKEAVEDCGFTVEATRHDFDVASNQEFAIQALYRELSKFASKDDEHDLYMEFRDFARYDVKFGELINRWIV